MLLAGLDIGTTGIAPHAMYSLPKLMWLKRHQAERFARARRACQMQEYVVLLLTGVAQLDHSLASRTMAFDLHRLAWSAKLLAAAGIGGALIRWFIDTLAGHSAARARERQRSLYLTLEEGWDGRPAGILALPHFAGAATPHMDPGSRGAFLGLTLARTEHHLYIAIMEGVCYEMRLNMECLREAGVRIPALRATGGGANSRVWMQMKADILGVPVTALESQEAGAAGSAMLAGVATGVFPNLRQAAGRMVRERETFHPHAKAQQAYTDAYARYRRVYGAVRPLME